jgi:uncharacterized protein (DUF1015 family)
VPQIRAFRALRYSASAVPDLSAVLCPPYDVIDERSRSELLARHERNAVRLELPVAAHGRATGDDEPYRAAARAAAEWRTDGVLVKDRKPTVTLHEMTWQDGEGQARTALGVFGRLRLEPLGPGSGVRPHERTMTGPKEDRYRLLKATGLNVSPVVLLGDGGPSVEDALRDVAARPPGAEAVTQDGVRHRVWILPAAADDAGTEAQRILAGVSGAPLTIADGHHRYETALRYREERGRNRACESDPAWDYVLALVYPMGLAPPVLPTHRVVRDGPSGAELLAAAADLFEVEPLPSGAGLLERMRHAPPTGEGTGTGRLGVLTAGVAAVLTARSERLDALLDPAFSPASRGLDVNILAAALERLVGVDPPALAAGGRLTYVKDAGEAVALVERREAAACFLLDPVPASAVIRVADAGEVMPQKSTYFHPKAPTGLLFGPLEW